VQHVNIKYQESLVIEEEATKKKAKKGSSTKLDSGEVFQDSNLAHIYGYSPYNIPCSLDNLLDEKYRRANKKRVEMSKILELDATFYQMNKKKMC
jgi:hypothetical protein